VVVDDQREEKIPSNTEWFEDLYRAVTSRDTSFPEMCGKMKLCEEMPHVLEEKGCVVRYLARI
jgi:hypothetical protein